MTLSRLLAALEQVEGQLAELYQELTDSFGDDPGAVRIFSRLSLQERSHLNLVRYGRNLVRQSPRDFNPVELDTGLIEELLQAIRDFRTEHATPTLDQAVGFALWAEGFAAERVHRTVLTDSNPSLAKVIASLGAGDVEHQAALEEFAKERGINGFKK